ncbi:MAG: hypothetical protein FJ088_12680, partial [Deltaproteobacteria bacterium]|nr:hypothetical protein [Deltaproteobacteria bacterium]
PTEVTEDTTIQPFGLLPVEVQIKTDNEEVKPAGYLKVLYKDPLTEADTTFTMNLNGHKDIDEITLPTALCGGAYSGKAGEAVLLNGMGSKGGTEDIYSSGYLWFISEKPANSKVFLNVQSEGKTTFTPDMPGKYKVHLTVFTDKSAHFSDEVSCEIDVQ